MGLVGNVAEDFFNGTELIGLVVDDEISFVAEAFDVLAENPHAEGMEGADDGAGRFFAVGGGLGTANELGGALLHFAGGFVGEGDGKDICGVDTFLDQARHARSDDAGFARACAGQNQHGALGCFDRLALGWIEGR